MIKRVLKTVFLTVIERIKKIVKRRYYVGVIKDDIQKLKNSGGVIRHLTAEQKMQVYALWGGGRNFNPCDLS